MTRDYLLGHHDDEWARLAEQHTLWASELLDALRGAGIGPGSRVLEVGCGPGDLLMDLHTLTGDAHGLELDPSAVARAGARLPGRVRHGDLLDAPLEGPWDAIVVRWVFSFLPDAHAAAARLASALAPGGVLVVQDYDHDGLRIHPGHPAIDRCIEAMRAHYRRAGGNLWVALDLPAAFVAAGLTLDGLHPMVRSGLPNSPVWMWVERFLLGHVDEVVAAGLLSPAEREAFLAAWTERRDDPTTLLMSPIQLIVVGRASR